MRQVVELPEVIQREISVAVDEGFIVIHLPLTDMRKASVVFADEWPYPVKAVFLRDGEREGAEVTEDVLPR